VQIFKKHFKNFISNYKDIVELPSDINFKNIKKISTDTRTLLKNDIFIALKGENFNGDNFLKDAIKKHAKLCISEKKHKKTITVKSTSNFLRDFSKYIIEKNPKIKTIGITGTNGKTTTKEMVNSIIKQKFRTHCTKGNYNNQIGLPLTIMEMNSKTEYLILEMGTNSLGEIEILADIARPQISTITNIGKGHTEKLKNKKTIFKEKFHITKRFDKNSTFIFNMDDKIINKKYKDFPYSKESFGIYSNSSFKALKINKEYSSYHLKHNKIETKIKMKINGIGNIYNSLCAASIASVAGISMKDIKKGLESYVGIKNRFNIIKSKNRNLIINDTYNANPNSMANAIEMTNKIYPSMNKIAILGDMLELGEIEKNEHVKIGKLLLKNNFKKIYIYGKNFKNYSDGIKSKQKVEYIKRHKDILKFIDLKKINNTVILVKGSRGSKMENVFDYLKF